MDESLLMLCKNGQITKETALYAAVNADQLRKSSGCTWTELACEYKPIKFFVYDDKKEMDWMKNG